MCKISCCGYGIRASAKSTAVSVASEAKVGAVSAAASTAISANSGNLSGHASREMHLGSVIGASRDRSVAIGADGYAASNAQSTQICCLDLSTSEQLSCCGDQGCCYYSINCCGEGCSCGTDCCTSAISSAANDCFACLGPTLSCLGDSVVCLITGAVNAFIGD